MIQHCINQKINPRKAIILILICLFLLLSCGLKQTVLNESFIPYNWKRIAVLPFHGDEVFNRVAEELFAFCLLNQQHFSIIEPYTIKSTLKRSEKDLAHNHFTIREAQEIGRLVDADAVIIGSIHTKPKSIKFEGQSIAEAKLIDVQTGEHVLTVTCSSLSSSPVAEEDQLKFTPRTYSTTSGKHGQVVRAVENVAIALLPMIDDLSEKNVTTHDAIP